MSPESMDERDKEVPEPENMFLEVKRMYQAKKRYQKVKKRKTMKDLC